MYGKLSILLFFIFFIFLLNTAFKSLLFHHTIKNICLPVTATTWTPVMTARHGDTAFRSQVIEYALKNCIAKPG